MIGLLPGGKTVREQVMEVKECRKAEVIVVGGGPGGIGAALSIKDGVNLREVNYRALQDSLTKQGVPLPGVYSSLSTLSTA